MAYLDPDYAHDLFISYSHGDFDSTGTSPLKEWSAQFVKELIYELKWNEDFRNLGVFLDQQHRPGSGVDPTESLSELITREIRRSALLVILLCKPYLKSAWCKKELDSWLSHFGPQAVRNERRLIPVRLAPVENGSWPPSLLDEAGEPLPGFFFYDQKEKDANLGRPYKWKGALTNSAEFEAALMNLVGVVSVRLKEVRERLDRQREIEKHARQLEEGSLIYLHGRTCDAAHWSRAWEALDARGYGVVPVSPESDPTDDFDWRRKELTRVDTLLGCDAVLLIAGQHEDVIARDMSMIGRYSRNAAKARCDKLLPCAVYDPFGIGTRREVTRRTARALGIEWIDATSPGEWIPAMQAWLRQASEQMRRSA
jgi:hypothetical protein